MRRSTLVLILLLGWNASMAQSRSSGADRSVHSTPSSVPDTTSVVSISSIPPGADLFLNGHSAGKTPHQQIIDQSGTLIVRLFSPSVNHWMRSVTVDTVRLTAGSRIERHYEFDRVANIYSLPSGADISEESRVMGTTPLIYRQRLPAGVRIVVRKTGFEDLVLSDISGVSPIDPIRLQPVGIEHDSRSPDLILEGYDESGLNGTLVYATAGTMIVSGALAAYLKETGNRRFDEYLRTNDPSLLQSTRRYDRAAGVALAITQVTLAVLSYLVLME